MNTVSIAQFQNDMAAKLQSESFFADINVILLREKLFESEVELAAVWQTVSVGGKSGIGIVVMMPTVSVQDAEAPGPEMILNQKFIVLEEPNLNQGPTGTKLFAEDVGIALVQMLHEFALAQNITLFARGQVVTPNRDYENIRGVNVDLEFRFAPPSNAKVSAPTATIADDEATLTCATDGATIYYTLDGSFPGNGNPAAVQYANPFAVESGQQLRYAAYLAGSIGSDVWETIVP